MKDLIILEREKIKEFKKIIHIAKGKKTLNRFLYECDIDPFYIERIILERGIIIPTKDTIKKIADMSEGRVKYEQISDIFLRNKRPEIKKGQLWLTDIKGENGGLFYVKDINIGGDFSEHVKLLPLFTIQDKLSEEHINIKYISPRGITINYYMPLEGYFLVDKSGLLSLIDTLDFEDIESGEIKTIKL